MKILAIDVGLYAIEFILFDANQFITNKKIELLRHPNFQVEDLRLMLYFMEQIFDYSSQELSQYYFTPLNEMSEIYDVHFKDVESIIMPKQKGRIRLESAYILNFLIALDAWLGVWGVVDYIYYIQADQSTFVHPELTCQEYFEGNEIKAGSHAEHVIELLLNQQIDSDIDNELATILRTTQAELKKFWHYRQLYPECTFTETALKWQYFNMFDLPSEQIPSPKEALELTLFSPPKEKLAEANKWAKIILFNTCIGKKAHDGGTYHWNYTEWRFLLDASFVWEDGKFNVFPPLNKSGYYGIYGPGDKNHALFVPELQYLADKLELTFESMSHQKITFTAASTEKLIAAGFFIADVAYKEKNLPVHESANDWGEHALKDEHVKKFSAIFSMWKERVKPKKPILAQPGTNNNFTP